MAAVVLACESQSTRSVGWPALARHAERLTAVVVFPTPPFWLATAMIRATEPPLSENLAKHDLRCKLFHVEQSWSVENEREVTFPVTYPPQLPNCSTRNN